LGNCSSAAEISGLKAIGTAIGLKAAVCYPAIGAAEISGLKAAELGCSWCSCCRTRLQLGLQNTAAEKKKLQLQKGLKMGSKWATKRLQKG